MAVAYKGFRAYWVDPTTFEELQYAGAFEFCIISETSTPTRYSNFQTKETIINSLETAGIDTTKLGGYAAMEQTHPEYRDYLLQVAPLCPAIDPNNTGGNARLKLVGDGGYCIYTGNTPNGYNQPTGQIDLYDSDGNYIERTANIIAPIGSSSGTLFYAILNFDGTVAVGNATNCIIGVSSGSGDRYYTLQVGTISINANFASWLNAISPLPPPVTDPYSPGGESSKEGGTGDFDGTSTPVDFATLPTLSAVDSGFITIYNPTVAQLQSLASYMWSGAFDVDTFKKLFASPMDVILGLSIVPGPIPGIGPVDVKVGDRSTGVNMMKAMSQYIDIDCGTINVNEFWGAYLDYEPYTKAEIYLPFIGVHQIAVDDIMNKAVHIKYHVDILSGACSCEIKCGDSVLYTFIGSCAISVPVTGNDWTNVINGVITAASAIGTMVATGGASAPTSAGEIASAAVNSLKPTIEKSGSITGSGGILSGMKPVLILTRPRQALPGGQNTYTGYPSFMTKLLGDLTGYTEVHSIRLGGIDGTDSEISEIEELLKAGVIL